MPRIPSAAAAIVAFAVSLTGEAAADGEILLSHGKALAGNVTPGDAPGSAPGRAVTRSCSVCWSKTSTKAPSMLDMREADATIDRVVILAETRGPRWNVPPPGTD